MTSPFRLPTGPAEHVERALCVLAHPDDVDFGSAGTVATWTAAGTEVTYCIVTDGDAGGFDETPRDQMGPLRQAEQRAAAAAVGVSDVRFLGYPDGRLELTLDLRRDISRVIRQVRPQRVLTSSPERFWDRIGASHPDHMTVGESTLRAVYPDARNPFAFPELLADEGLDAWTVSEVWLGASPRADHAVDVTDVVDRKFAALRSHVTQVSHNPDLEKFVTAWMSQTASPVRPARRPAGRGLPRRPHHVICGPPDHTAATSRAPAAWSVSCHASGTLRAPLRVTRSLAGSPPWPTTHGRNWSSRRGRRRHPGDDVRLEGAAHGNQVLRHLVARAARRQAAPARLTELVEAGDAQPFEPMEGRRMNGWILLGDSATGRPWSRKRAATWPRRTPDMDVAALADLLHEAAETHHRVYRITDGEDRTGRPGTRPGC